MGSGSLDRVPMCPCLDEAFACFHEPSPSLNTLRRAFTLLARWPFASTDNMGEYGDALACVVWNPDDKLSKLKIQPASVMDPGDTSNVPGILVSIKDGLKLNRVGIGDTGSRMPDYSGRVSVFAGSVDIEFLCRHKDADVSCMMGDLLMLFFTAMQERMYDTFRWLRDYVPVGMTEPKMTAREGDPDTKWYETVFTLHIDFEYGVFSTREAPLMRHVEVAASPVGLTEDGNPPPDRVLVPFDGSWPKHLS